MVELNDFIAEALTSIVKGIQQGQATDIGDHIAPLIQGKQRNERGNFYLKKDKSNQATIVQFDVQVATEVEAKGKGGGEAKLRLYVVNLKMGTGGGAGAKTSNLHRLQFSIPIKIPRRSTDGSQDVSSQ